MPSVLGMSAVSLSVVVSLSVCMSISVSICQSVFLSLLSVYVVVSQSTVCFKKKTSPTFLAVTLESIIGFSKFLAHVLLRK